MFRILKDKLNNQRTTRFAVVVNNKLMHYKDKDNKNKIVYAYADGKTGELNFGYYERVHLHYADNKEKTDKMTTRFVVNNEIQELLAEELLSEDIFGINMPNISHGRINCSVNNEFRVVHIYSELHNLIKKIVNESPRPISLPTKDHESITLRRADLNKLNTNFLEEMYIRYKTIFFEIIDKKSYRIQTNDWHTMQLFKISKQFINVTANGDFLYNPLFEHKETFDLFSETLFYKLITQQEQPRSGKMQLYFLTIKETCEGLGMTDENTKQHVFVRLNNKHVTPLLFGQNIMGILEGNADSDEDILNMAVALKGSEFDHTDEPKTMSVYSYFDLKEKYDKDTNSTEINPYHYKLLKPTEYLAYRYPIKGINTRLLIEYFKSCKRVIV